MFAFTAHHLISAPVSADWVYSILPAGDLSAPLNPPFLSARAERIGRLVDNIDAVFLAPPLASPDRKLKTANDMDHQRADQARRHRIDVRVWTVDSGMLTLGRGVAGRWEVSVEVGEAARGWGIGRALFLAARGLVNEPVWAQVAPGNAASVRAVLAAGFRPIGAEALLIPGEP